MIEPGTEVTFEWQECEVYYNTDVEYGPVEIKRGIVLPFDENNWQDMEIKKRGDQVKVSVEDRRWGRKYTDIYYPEEKHVHVIDWKDKLVELWKKIFPYRIMIYKVH